MEPLENKEEIPNPAIDVDDLPKIKKINYSNINDEGGITSLIPPLSAPFSRYDALSAWTLL